MSRRSPIHTGERWRHRELGDEGEVTGMFTAQVRVAGEVQSWWFITIAYEIGRVGETTPQRWEERLFLDTHQFLQEAIRG